MQALSYTTLAVVAAMVGGVVAVYRAPGDQMESNVQHFAAGVVTAAVAAELLPDVHESAPTVVVVVGFAVGVAGVVALPDGTTPLRRLAVSAGFGTLLTVGIPALEGVTGAPISVILASGAAALLSLVTEELLVKASKVPETPVSTTLFFVGFLSIFLLDMLH